MTKGKMRKQKKAINIENNSPSYFPILTAIQTQIALLISIKKSKFVV